MGRGEKSNSKESYERAHEIAKLFDLPDPIEVADFAEKGNINQQTYLVKSGLPGNRAECILQRLNPFVFTKPQAVMNAMTACIQAQQKALSEGILRDGEEWEPIRLMPARDGRMFLEISDGTELQCWRMMARIGGAHAYKNLLEIPDPGARLCVAEEAGKGLALFGALTAAMDPSQFSCPLPGYRDTPLYYDQLLSILASNRTPAEAAAYLPSDKTVRQSTESHFLVHISEAEYRLRKEDARLRPFIALALEQKSYAISLTKGLASGAIRKTVIHGDTKLENFLFSNATGRIRALVDLDTIMPHTWLSDWGDMVRSLTNIAGEREKNPDKIEVDLDIFQAVARGFLKSARHIPSQEIELMADAPQILALELGMRFLADYLRGDSYFKLGPGDPPDLNRTRAIVQFRLFNNLRANVDRLKRCIEEESGLAKRSQESGVRISRF